MQSEMSGSSSALIDIDTVLHFPQLLPDLGIFPSAAGGVRVHLRSRRQVPKVHGGGD